MSSIDARVMQLQGELAQMHQQVRHAQKLASLGTAAAMLAHEFNNIMTPIVGYAQYALSSKDSALMTKALETTLRQTETALGMSERILGLARDEPVSFASVPLREVVDGAVACLCRDLTKDGITLSLNVASETKVRADARQLRQVFFNLLLNARDAIEGRSGRITIDAAESDEGAVRITFCDTGCGIPRERLSSVFNTFVTSKAARNGNGMGGTGLGLAICREIIEEHGGSIGVQSSLGEGTTFTIILASPA